MRTIYWMKNARKKRILFHFIFACMREGENNIGKICNKLAHFFGKIVNFGCYEKVVTIANYMQSHFRSILSFGNQTKLKLKSTYWSNNWIPKIWKHIYRHEFHLVYYFKLHHIKLLYVSLFSLKMNVAIHSSSQYVP